MTAVSRALVIIDAQNEYFDGPLSIVHPPREESLAAIIRAIDVANEHRLPIVAVQHTNPVGAAVFADGSDGWRLHPAIERLVTPEWKIVRKRSATVFGDTDVAPWLSERGVDAITIAGYMTNNCDLATAADAGVRGFSAEILADATGAISLANAAGAVTAQQLHQTLLVLLHSNFAAVTTVAEWADAVKQGRPSPKGNLVDSALAATALSQ